MEVIKIWSERRYLHILLKLLPILLLICFIIIMNSGYYLKQPKNEQEDVYAFLSQASTLIEKEEWAEAKKVILRAETGWQRIAKRIQFSAERSHMNEIEAQLIRIKTYIDMKDQRSALVEINETKHIWKELGV